MQYLGGFGGACTLTGSATTRNTSYDTLQHSRIDLKNGAEFEKIQIFRFAQELVTLEDFILSAKTKYVTTTSRDAKWHRDSKRCGL